MFVKAEVKAFEPVKLARLSSVLRASLKVLVENMRFIFRARGEREKSRKERPVNKEGSTPGLPENIPNLLSAVELELGRFSPVLLFSSQIEKRFVADTLPERLLQWRINGSIGAILYGWPLAGDFQLLPDVWSLAIFVRMGVLVLGLIGSNVISRLPIAVSAREFVLAFLCLVAIGGMVCLFTVSHSPYKWVYVSGMLLVVVFNSVCLPNRFYMLLPTIFLSGVIIALGLLMSPLPPDVKFWEINMTCSLMILTVIANFRFEKQVRRAYLLSLKEILRNAMLVDNNARLRTLSEIDSLTGILNRGAIDDGLMKAISASQITGQFMGLLMLDVDFFKAFNDRYGHQGGDDCLRRLAALFDAQLRSCDLLGRFGGEEFLIVLPGLDAAGCFIVGERIRLAVEAAQIPHTGRGDTLQYVTVSIGLASFSPASNQNRADLISQADDELYSAKRAGRNRVRPLISITPTQDSLISDQPDKAGQAARLNENKFIRNDAA